MFTLLVCITGLAVLLSSIGTSEQSVETEAFECGYTKTGYSVFTGSEVAMAAVLVLLFECEVLVLLVPLLGESSYTKVN